MIVARDRRVLGLEAITRNRRDSIAPAVIVPRTECGVPSLAR